MYGEVQQQLKGEIDSIREARLYKEERVLQTPQAARVEVPSGEVLNLCANNYLGLSSHPELVHAAHEGLDRWGFGLSSVRFICGTQQVHKDLEETISRFMGYDDTILFSSCFDANGALFEPLLGEEDAILSDALNHASIIDGIRLCKARRYRYAHGDMADLEAKLIEAKDARRRMVFTDGVFSMDGDVAKLDEICALADKYDAMVGVDDCHATGFLGATGRGTGELKGVQDRIDVVTGTLGKALGGASGGYVTGRREIVEMLRQRGRPYLFSNALMPAIAHASIAAFRLVDESRDLIEALRENTAYFRERIREIGFEIKPGETPIVPIMVYDAALASRMADEMLQEGVYVIGFSYPVVPKGEARIRTQLSAAHSRNDLDRALDAFERVGRRVGVLSD
jgi:glycine C-acetyltransferase